MMKRILLALIVAMTLTSCSEEISEVTHESRMLSFYIEEDGGNTRAITSGMSTTFEVGDIAGVFAVKDGKVLENFNNAPLTYQQTGSWQMATATEYSKELEGVKFYAYYPYDANMNFNASIADPFNDYVNNFKPTLKQATKSGYEAADLMTSQATPIGELNDVRIKMKHRMAMANVELPNQAYTFTNEGMEPYVLKSASHCSFTMDGESVFPYFDKGSQTYRIITKPNSRNQLQLSYIDGNTEKEVALDLSILSSGQAHIYKVDGGANIQSFTLQIGDYLCQDGSLLSKDTPLSTEDAKKVIGVVYRLGTAACLQEDYPAATHAEVIALKIGSSIGKDATAQWGGIKDPGSAWKGWYSAYGINALGAKINDVAETTLTDIGYQQTKLWLKAESPLTFNNEKKDIHGEFLSTYKSFTTNYPSPSKATSWYVPALRDFIYIYSSKDVIDASLNTAGGDAIDIIGNKYYWTSQLSTENTMWACNGMTINNFQRQNFYNKQCHRFVIAF